MKFSQPIWVKRYWSSMVTVWVVSLNPTTGDSAGTTCPETDHLPSSLGKSNEAKLPNPSRELSKSNISSSRSWRSNKCLIFSVRSLWSEASSSSICKQNQNVLYNQKYFTSMTPPIFWQIELVNLQNSPPSVPSEPDARMLSVPTSAPHAHVVPPSAP